MPELFPGDVHNTNLPTPAGIAQQPDSLLLVPAALNHRELVGQCHRSLFHSIGAENVKFFACVRHQNVRLPITVPVARADGLAAGHVVGPDLNRG